MGAHCVGNDRGIVETAASFEACYAPLSYPTAGRGQQRPSLPRYLVMIMAVHRGGLPLPKCSTSNLVVIASYMYVNVNTRVPELEMPHLEMWR